MFVLKSACLFFFVTTVMWNHLWGFQLCYTDRCLNDLLLLSISCSAEFASKIKDQLPPNYDRLFRNDAGICFTTTALFFSWGQVRKLLPNIDVDHHPQNLPWFFSLKLYLQANYTASLTSTNVWWKSSPCFLWILHLPLSERRDLFIYLFVYCLRAVNLTMEKKCSLAVYSVVGTEWGSVCDSVFKDK